MTAWTVEQHEHPKYGGPTWFAVAPRDNPDAGLHGHYPHTYRIHGRRAVPFTDQERARRSAEGAA